jgi:hypothetical protein
MNDSGRVEQPQFSATFDTAEVLGDLVALRHYEKASECGWRRQCSENLMRLSPVSTEK